MRLKLETNLVNNYDDIKTYFNIIAEKRINSFKNFPYLYSGNIEYEKEYIKGFLNSKKSSIIITKNHQNEIIAITTATAMDKELNITKDSYDYFVNNSLNPSSFYYISEIIIDPEYQKKGLLKKHLSLIQEFAKEKKYLYTCFLTVDREKDDPRKPQDYYCHDQVFLKAGYVKTKIKTEFNWPTILEDGSVKDMTNKMSFWTYRL